MLLIKIKLLINVKKFISIIELNQNIIKGKKIKIKSKNKSMLIGMIFNLYKLLSLMILNLKPHIPNNSN